MTIKFLDLKSINKGIENEISAAIQDVLDSGQYIGGRFVEDFERDFAHYTGFKYCVAVASGLDALVLSLRAMGIKRGDEVLVPSNTFIATWLAVTACGATPIPIEPDEATYNMDANRLSASLTDRTRAIIPVHLYGLPANMREISEFAERHGLIVIEDSAQAHGAVFGDTSTTGKSHAAAWSFYPGKNLGALGDGGAVTTNDSAVASNLALLRNYGSREKYIHEVQGTNSRLDALQAAVLRAKLKFLDDWNAKRTHLATLYARGLEGQGLILPAMPPHISSAWHLYVVRHPKRDVIRERLAQEGIETLVHYPIPPHKQAAYAYACSHYHLPIAERLAAEVLSLPMGPHLSPADISSINESLSRILRDV